MSFENRLRILPVGVVSKNFMGLRRILRKSSSWSLEEALSVPWVEEHRTKETVGSLQGMTLGSSPKAKDHPGSEMT